jgi:hypothetical protein
MQKLKGDLDILGGNYNQHSSSVKDHLEQLYTQVIASALVSAAGVPKLLKAKSFNSTRTKLRGFLTQIDIHLDVNKGRLFSEASKVIFVLAYLRGQA